MASKFTEDLLRMTKSNLALDQFAATYARRPGANGQTERLHNAEGMSNDKLMALVKEVDENVRQTRPTKLVLELPRHILTPLSNPAISSAPPSNASASPDDKIDPEWVRRAERLFNLSEHHRLSALLDNSDGRAHAQAYLQQLMREAGSPRDPFERELIICYATLSLTSLRLMAESNQSNYPKTQIHLMEEALKADDEARRQAVALAKYRKTTMASKAAPLGWRASPVSQTNGAPSDAVDTFAKVKHGG